MCPVVATSTAVHVSTSPKALVSMALSAQATIRASSQLLASPTDAAADLREKENSSIKISSKEIDMSTNWCPLLCLPRRPYGPHHNRVPQSLEPM